MSNWFREAVGDALWLFVTNDQTRTLVPEKLKQAVIVGVKGKNTLQH